LGKILIVGFGNILMGDDGAGINLIQRMANCQLSEQVELLDGGVNSFAALAELQEASLAILIDTMKGGGEPGDIYRLTQDQIGSQNCGQRMSVHDFSLMDSLQLAKQMGDLPPIIIYGIEPATVELMTEISAPVAMAVDTVIAKIFEDLRSIIQRR
jgi:hydrogenase maturation protease